MSRGASGTRAACTIVAHVAVASVYLSAVVTQEFLASWMYVFDVLMKSNVLNTATSSDAVRPSSALKDSAFLCAFVVTAWLIQSCEKKSQGSNTEAASVPNVCFTVIGQVAAGCPSWLL